MDYRAVEGRITLSIDHGPFPTACAYFQACAECEHAATHALFTHGAPAGAEYQALLAEMQGIVEHAVMLLIELVRRCKGLDRADPEPPSGTRAPAERGRWSCYSRSAHAAHYLAAYLARPCHQVDTSVAAERDSLVRQVVRCPGNWGRIACGDRYESWGNAMASMSACGAKLIASRSLLSSPQIQHSIHCA